MALNGRNSETSKSSLTVENDAVCGDPGPALHTSNRFESESLNVSSKQLTVGLLSHYLEDDNLGCVALSMSNMALMDEVADSLAIDLDYKMIVSEKYAPVPAVRSSTPVEYRHFDSAKRALKRPDKYVRSRVFDGCDLVANINAGDGFTDLYGPGRVLTESYMTLLAQQKGIPVVLAPQTIGPFESRWSKVVASRVVSRSAVVFPRDAMSAAAARELGGLDVREVIDVAFALPFERDPSVVSPDLLDVGINVSGLLYRGGYSGENFFGLSFDYREFVHHLVATCVRLGHRVHLVPHVLAAGGNVEDDASACRAVASEFPQVVVAPSFKDAVAVKSYIASLDFFTGARMHSTIAAASSGVPVVPIGYSKKTNGLYDTLDYPYYIDARADWTTGQAVQQIVDWIEDRESVHARLNRAREVFEERLDLYRRHLAELMLKHARTVAG